MFLSSCRYIWGNDHICSMYSCLCTFLLDSYSKLSAVPNLQRGIVRNISVQSLHVGRPVSRTSLCSSPPPRQHTMPSGRGRRAGYQPGEFHDTMLALSVGATPRPSTTPHGSPSYSGLSISQRTFSPLESSLEANSRSTARPSMSTLRTSERGTDAGLQQVRVCA